MKKLLFLLLLISGIITFSGCGPTRYTVVSQPVAPAYARPVAPGPQYVWVDGDWYWSSGRYVYRNGYWARPRVRHIYMPGAWVSTPRGYYWRRGHWR